jgi:hypothetical protein
MGLGTFWDYEILELNWGRDFWSPEGISQNFFGHLYFGIFESRRHPTECSDLKSHKLFPELPEAFQELQDALLDRALISPTSK